MTGNGCDPNFFRCFILEDINISIPNINFTTLPSHNLCLLKKAYPAGGGVLFDLPDV